jgi:glycosyltransferase involved in cell wall biosynthesis
MVRQNYFPQEAHVRKNVDALVDAGFKVDVVCLRETGEAAGDGYSGGRVTRLPLTHRRGGKARYAFEYLAFLAMAFLVLAWRSLRRPYDVVEVYNIPDILAFAALPAKLRGSKVVVYLFELMPEQVRDEYGLADSHLLIRALRWAERWAVRLADRVVTVSPYDARLIESRARPRQAPLVVLNVPEEKLFNQDGEAAGDAPLRLITHGSILKRYGIETLVRAMPLVREHVPRAEAWIVGEGEYRDELEAVSGTLGLGEAVRFLGWRPIEEVPDLIRGADIGVVPALVPWLLPNKLFEYVAVGTPVVAADSPSVRSIFPNGEISYFPPGDEEELARCVIELNADPAQARQQAERAAAVLDSCRWDVSKRAYTSLHRDLVESRR